MKRTRLLPFLLGALVSAAIYALYFGHAFFVDEGSYCTLAQGILNGQLPYRDYFNEKGPLHYFLTAFVMSLSLPGIAGGRITSSVLLALTLGLLFRPLLTAGCDRATRHAWFAAVVLSALGMSVLNNTGEATLAFAVALSATQLLLPGPPTRSRIWIIGLAHGLASGARLTMLLPAFICCSSPWGTRAGATICWPWAPVSRSGCCPSSPSASGMTFFSPGCISTWGTRRSPAIWAISHGPTCP
jgi:hypothetical protein